MENQTLLEQFSELVKQEFNKEILTELKGLHKTIADGFKAEEQKQLEAFLEDEENDSKDFVPAHNAEKEAFYALADTYKEKRKAYAEQRALEEKTNLKAKTELIVELATVTEKEENIAKAYNRFNELKEKWDTIGRIPGDKHKEINTQFHQALDNFYYNINIYKELQQLDLKKNFDGKKEIVEKLEKVDTSQGLKQLDEEVKALQNEWYNLGPVPKEEYEPLKEKFTATTNKIYDSIRAKREVQQKELLVNLEKKKTLLEEAKQFEYSGLNSHKEWKKATEAILDIQNRWKEIGFGPKKENEAVWGEFRVIADAFFDKKQIFYDGLKKGFELNKKQKESLCENAEALQESTNWDETTKKLIALQRKWKDIGSVGQKDEQKLWNRFRGVCNTFFDAKSNHFEGRKEEQVENLKQKQALLVEFEKLTLSDDKDKNLSAIKDFTKKWNSLGFVPKESIDELKSAYEKALNEKFESAGISKDEVEHGKLVSRIQNILSQEDSDYLIKKEYRFYDDLIAQHKATVLQYETNLSFFSNSSGKDNPLMKDALKKVSSEQHKIKRLEEQKTMVQKMYRQAVNEAKKTEEVVKETQTETAD
jgi:hypothetical protein